MCKVFRLVSLVGLTAILALGLSGCGGGSSSSSTPPTSSSSTNVALASAGASITTSYAGNESFVIDGDTGTTNYWQAGSVDDWLLIDFGAVYDIESVDISATSIGSTSNFTMEYSSDGGSYTTLNNFSSCGAAMTIGASGYTCEFGTTYSARYFRYTAKVVTTPQIHEIEIMGQ